MTFLIISIPVLLALLVWKVWAIERRLRTMHISWVKVMEPITEMSGEPALFSGGQERHTGHRPRSVLDQIGIQVELATLEQREQRQQARTAKDADLKEFGEYR